MYVLRNRVQEGEMAYAKPYSPQEAEIGAPFVHKAKSRPISSAPFQAPFCSGCFKVLCEAAWCHCSFTSEVDALLPRPTPSSRCLGSTKSQVWCPGLENGDAWGSRVMVPRVEGNSSSTVFLFPDGVAPGAPFYRWESDHAKTCGESG